MRADDQDSVVPGNALAMRHDKPFAGLQGFGNAFLEKLQGAEVYCCPILDNVTLVDTPGCCRSHSDWAGTTTSPRSCGGSRNDQT